jgi:5-methylcytosine-specific restriction enzyme A
MPRMPEPKPRKQMHERRHQEKRYNTTAWRKYRVVHLTYHPLCVECNEIAEVVDHIVPVRMGGNFWDPYNHQSLCHRCHNAKSGRESHIPVAYGKKER